MNNVQKCILTIASISEIFLFLETIDPFWDPAPTYRLMVGIGVVATILYFVWEKKGKTK